MDRPNPARALVETLFDELVASLERGDSSALTQYFTALQRFHHYSFTNIMLIAAQRPTATRVAGFHTWRRFNRTVRRGEKGIAILAPVMRRRRLDTDSETDEVACGEDESASRSVAGWRTVHVFALDQTDGDPLPASQGN